MEARTQWDMWNPETWTDTDRAFIDAARNLTPEELEKMLVLVKLFERSNKTADAPAEPISLDTLERLDTIREGLHALEMMISAYFMGPDEFDERRTVNAMTAIINQLHEKVTFTEYEIRAALQGLKMA
jgi:hypothetical protein